MICWLPVERALSTTFCISQGERNWPFLMFTGLPCEHTADDEIGLPAEERRRLQHIDHGGDFLQRRVLMHVRQHRHADLLAHPASALRPASSPGPRKLAREERLALSKEALKMKGMPSAAVISFRRPATSITRASLSMTQGPAIKKNGRSCPTSKDASFMRSAVARPGCSAARYSRAARTKPVNKRMPVARRRGEFRMKLTGHEPGMEPATR